jgi:hypothetical protein
VLPGELTYRAYPGGVDDISEVASEGFPLVLSGKALGSWCTVVPDQDGAIRVQWESPE